MTKYYPIMLDIANKRCIVIGGGNVAYRKVKSLLNFNALVRVISNDLCPELQELKAENKIEWISRNYMIGDLTDSVLVFAATDSVQTNQTIHREAQAKGIMTNIADNPDLCEFIIPATIQQGDLTIAISTNGKSPALAKKIRIELENKLRSNYAEFLNLMGEIRETAIEEIQDNNKREEFFTELVNSDMLEKISRGEIEQAREEMNIIFDCYKQNAAQV